MASREERIVILNKRSSVMNAKRLIIAAGTALTLSAVLLPATASADNRGYYGPPQGYGYGYGRPGHGHGHYKPWKRGYYGPPAVVIPAPVYAVPYPRYVPVPVYAPPPPPVYYPPVGNDLTIIWRAGW
jgi:hypothetical protein